MTQQLEISFETASPINRKILSGQNRRLYDWLLDGHTIHCFHSARRELKIGYLNSRISDLINSFGINIHKRQIHVKNWFGDDVSVIEYSLNPFPDAD